MQLDQLSKYLSQPELIQKYKIFPSTQRSHIYRKRTQKSELDTESQQSSIISDRVNYIHRNSRLLAKSISNQDLPKTMKILFRIGDDYLKKKKISSAFFIYRAILSLANFFANIVFRTEALIRISDLYKIVSQFNNSLKILRKALESAWMMRSPTYQLLVYDKLGIIHYISGDIEKADYYHRRFTQSQLQHQQSPAYIVGIQNSRDTWHHLLKNKHEKFNIHILEMSNIFRSSSSKSKQHEFDESFIEQHLILDTKEAFEFSSNIFLESSEFSEKIISIEPLMVKQPLSYMGSKKTSNKNISHDHVQKLRNYNKLKQSVKHRKQEVNIKSNNLDKIIEERIKYVQPQFEKYYQQLKRKSKSISIEQKRVNLPVLISHIKRGRYL